MPISIVWRPDRIGDGPAPCLLYGYGAYEASMDPWFSVARLSLLDPGDAMVASGGAREVAGAVTTVTLQPAAPLKPGASYRLRVDGATTREVRAADGTSRAPVEFPLLITGEAQPEPKPKARPRRKQRH